MNFNLFNIIKKYFTKKNQINNKHVVPCTNQEGHLLQFVKIEESEHIAGCYFTPVYEMQCKYCKMPASVLFLAEISRINNK